ncbi:MAG: hydantoinase/oxoprolinase family protein [Actinobacteria bacterium]|nr:MAG: hydantoinase/oxoprolinase family protein [Actinomycetota bacterium]
MSNATCIGIDVGGTFTDAVLSDQRGLWRAKVPTTVPDVGAGVLDACEAVARRAGRALDAILASTDRFGLGTTVVTNLIATRSGRRVGLLTTRGFEALVPIARGALVVDDGWLAPPPQLVTRACIVGIDERIDRNGAVLRPLAIDEVVAAGRRLVAQHGVEALAVSFLWSFREPAHEHAAVAALEAALPDIPVSSGAALHPAIREYERTMAALLNAYTAGALDPISAVATALTARGLRVPVLLVHSNGGTVTFEEAQRRPAALVGSGPAAGVAAAGALVPIGDVVTCDMGGTSLDIGLVHDGAPSRAVRGPVMGFWTASSRLEITSIGAGGGSIAWRDARGMLRVGPQSAGADPGPACYGLGGTAPTLTDALVLLGYLDPERFLDGARVLDTGAACRACATLGAELGLSLEAVAWGIRRVALSGMAKAVQRELATRGLDPRTHTLVSYGGCGGLFACDLARSIGIRRVLVPESASVLSALGAATTDVRRERVRSLAVLLPVDATEVTRVARELVTAVEGDLAADGMAPADCSVTLEADLRFKRQTFELTIPLDACEHEVNEALGDAFRARYAARYGEAAMMRGAPIELVSVRAVGTGRVPSAARVVVHDDRAATAAPTSARVRVGRASDDVCDVRVIPGPALKPGMKIVGPTLIDEGDTRVWLPAGTTARVDDDTSLVIEVTP